MANDKICECTDWKKADYFAGQALQEAMDAAEIAAGGDYELADEIAHDACTSRLQSRLASFNF